ncbi:hypothetical protein T11_3166 [Trichinella zimbabwensis]|uniref:Uncharacterized protein n=1 Tax=Trichinella zimbabwensis TaxID=268475 RepID=A0A0V1I9S0_9BILA|nr:hypothetical protein T11_3166 [Trichinella zimbabwensis]
MRELEKPKVDNSAVSKKTGQLIKTDEGFLHLQDLTKHMIQLLFIFQMQVESHLKDVGDLIRLLVLVDLDLSSELPNSAVPSVLGS